MSVAFVPHKTRISVDRYQKMVAAGVLTERDRIELLDGEMIDLAPIGPKHAALTARLTKLLVLAVGDTAIVSPGGPVNLGDFSEPQPDLLVLRPRADYYAGKIPEASDVLLLIEISDSTLAFDQNTKLELYARHGVVEYWIIDVEGKRVQVHREPTVKWRISRNGPTRFPLIGPTLDGLPAEPQATSFTRPFCATQVSSP